MGFAKSQQLFSFHITDPRENLVCTLGLCWPHKLHLTQPSSNLFKEQHKPCNKHCSCWWTLNFFYDSLRRLILHSPQYCPFSYSHLTPTSSYFGFWAGQMYRSSKNGLGRAQKIFPLSPGKAPFIYCSIYHYRTSWLFEATNKGNFIQVNQHLEAWHLPCQPSGYIQMYPSGIFF